MAILKGWILASPSNRVAGFAYAAGQSRRYSATLVPNGDGFDLFDSGQTLLVHSAAERQAMIGNAKLRVNLGLDWQFETDDIDALDQVLPPPIDDKLRGFERFSAWSMAAIFGCVFGVIAIWRWGLDVLVLIALLLTPPVVTRAIDKGNMITFDRTIAAPSNLTLEQQAEITQIFDRVVSEVPKADRYDFNLNFRDMKLFGPNAFALPGGTIVITDDFVRLFDEPDVLAGVIGHELAHVTEQHGLRQLYRNLSVYVLVAIVAGDVGPVLDEMLLEGSVLLSLSYSRRHEREADRVGLGFAQQAGFDPAGLLVFFEYTADEVEGRGNSWLSTHPSSRERIEAIKDLFESGN